MTSPNRQAERTERSTEALLDAAAELIAEGGLSSMTFNALGERAGYSRGLVTARFGSKRGLVDALIHRIWRRLRDRDVLPVAQRDHGLEEILVLVDAIREQAEVERRDMRAMFALTFEALGPDESLRERMVEFTTSMRSDLAAAVRRGLTDGSVRADIDPDVAAVLIASALQGLAYEWLLQPDAVELDRAYTALGALLRDYLAPLREVSG